jgi:hypothetical protein
MISNVASQLAAKFANQAEKELNPQASLPTGVQS